ncbi:MAG: hypothetical protein GX288_01015 [Clostridiales bacterium]|nr:hypothetical protein [Clostridiales bacterium]
MVQYLFEQKILMYVMVGLGGLGLLARFIINLVYKKLVKESDNMGGTKHKTLKHMKMKFETCYKLKIGVNNVDTFVDRNLLRYKFCGLLLSTWENLCGQVLFLSLLLVPVSTVVGVISKVDQQLILSTGSVGIIASAILIIVDKSINLYSKKQIVKYNLLDYLENFCKVRLEQEAFNPELLEQYRKEYFGLVGAEGESAAASSKIEQKIEEPKDELNRRREAKLRKELEKKALAQKREEEQKRLEAMRREEERRRIEERKMLAAKRREEERLRLEEERQALEARRLEAKRKAEEKKAANLRKLQSTEELISKNLLQNTEEIISENVTGSLEEYNLKKQIENVGQPIHIMETKISKKIDTDELENETQGLQGIEEVAATKLTSEATPKEELPKQNKAKIKLKPMSPEEEKLVQDVLKQFFT